MAPTENNNVPQRFRQRFSPSSNDRIMSSGSDEAPKSSAEAQQKHWENLLDRRKKCKERLFKERYDHIKKELTDATTSLARLDHKASTVPYSSTNNLPVIKLGPMSFLPKGSNSSVNGVT